VTVNPKQAPAGAYTVLDVRVPNERDNASTTKVVVQMPPGFVAASYEPVPGWRTTVARQTLSKPIQTPDGPITEGVSTITWTGTGTGLGAIAPGQFRDFPLSVQIPGKAGDTLTFKALQTYSNGEVVRWIGGADADQPAATVQVVAAPAAAAATPAAATTPTASTAAAGGEDRSSSSSDTLAIVALVVGALGLAAGLGAVAVSRRPRRLA
jgi:uncharacterized protein